MPTVLKSIPGAFYWGADNQIPFSALKRIWVSGGKLYAKYVSGDTIIDGEDYFNIINPATGVAFVSAAALRTYLDTGFFL